MKPLILKVIALGIASVAFIFWSFNDSPVVVNQALLDQANKLNDKDPAYMSGCQTHHGPVTPKVIYPTVNKNFVTPLCALEVPPSNLVIAQQRTVWGPQAQ